MRTRATILVGAAAGAVALAAAMAASPVLQRVELQLYDAFLDRARGGMDPPRTVAVAAVDDASVARFGRWPWPRDRLALLVDALVEAGASAVALDLLLSEFDNPAGDQALVEALGRGRVVVSHALTFATGDEEAGNVCGIPPLPAVRIAAGGSPPPEARLFSTGGGVCSLPSFSRSAAGSGVVNVAPDPDGVYRRVPLLMWTGEDLVPALALAAVLQARGSGASTLRAGPAGDLRLELGGTAIPLDRQGALAVPFRGRVGGVQHFSAADVLEDRLPPDALRDRVVFVGATALGMGDRVPTPLGEPASGVEIHALVAAGLLEADLLSTPAWGHALGLLLMPAAGSGVAALVAWLGLMVGGGVGLLLILAGWGGSLGLFASSGILLSPLLPTLGAAAALAALVVARVGIERGLAGEERARGDRTEDFAVQSLTALVETRDRATGLHARRTGEYVGLIAERLRRSPRFREYLTPERIRLLTRLAPLHDIGKVGIPDAVLNKPGALTDNEMVEIRKHPELGYRAILQAEEAAGLTGERAVEALTVGKELVRFHHECWDGKGYPLGLSGEEIPIPARIMAVVDVYDALVQTRVYREAGSHEQARAVIEAGRGTAFDPEVVDAFLEAEEEFRRRTAAYHVAAGGEG